jgi:hypothetical protein
MGTKATRMRPWLVTAAVVAGAGLGSAGIASAATSSSSSSSTAPVTSAPAPQGTSSGAPQSPSGMPAGAPDPSTMAHGPNETLLSGDDLSKATAAAQASQPGATVIRAETDSSGKGTYEVHMKKADGSTVTVFLDAGFSVTGTDSGFGAGPAGGQPPAAPASGSTSTR